MGLKSFPAASRIFLQPFGRVGKHIHVRQGERFDLIVAEDFRKGVLQDYIEDFPVRFQFFDLRKPLPEFRVGGLGFQDPPGLFLLVGRTFLRQPVVKTEVLVKADQEFSREVLVHNLMFTPVSSQQSM